MVADLQAAVSLFLREWGLVGFPESLWHLESVGLFPKALGVLDNHCCQDWSTSLGVEET